MTVSFQIKRTMAAHGGKIQQIPAGGARPTAESRPGTCKRRQKKQCRKDIQNAEEKGRRNQKAKEQEKGMGGAVNAQVWHAAAKSKTTCGSTGQQKLLIHQRRREEKYEKKRTEKEVEEER